MKQIYESPQQTRSPETWPFTALVFAVALVLAWPALFLGLLIGLGGKHWSFPRLVWIGLAGAGLAGGWLLCMQVGTAAVLHTMIQHIPPFATWLHLDTVRAFLPYFVPLWLRSLLLTPLLALAIHLFPQRMEEQLLRQERDRISRQERASRKAQRRLRHVPDQIKGQAVLGAIIHPPR